MLELALALPILLFIMALIINYGAVAAWKVREHSAARRAVWQTRWPRTGASDPRPGYWPTAATMAASDRGNVPGMDDSRVDQPVARGPIPRAIVDANLLDPTRGLRVGSGDYTRQYPLLRKLGKYTITAENWLVDDKWQWQRMPLSDNWQRRVPVLYALAKAPASLVNSYVQSVLAIARAPFAAQLRPLDNDPDFIYYGALFGWGGPPDFHPRVQNMCTTDRRLTDQSVKNLIDHIQGNKRRHISSVAEVMARSFLSLYRRALAQSQNPILQSNIAQLQQFLKQLSAGSGP